MKHKTSELTGELLDAAVAKAEGLNWQLREWHGQTVCMADWVPGAPAQTVSHYQPTRDWYIGGPIIECNLITVGYDYLHMQWVSMCHDSRARPVHAFDYRSSLTASMRAYVASKLGEEVEL